MKCIVTDTNWYHGGLMGDITEHIVDEYGNEYWFVHGRLHREDGPAKALANGTLEWHVNGKLHREDGPAITLPDGSEIWYLCGKPHRTDGPAVVMEHVRYACWMKHGEVHRVDGPAVIRHDSVEWWVDGQRRCTHEQYAEATGLTEQELIVLIVRYGPIE